MFKKAILLLTALASLTIANAYAGGSVIVLSSNGYFAVVHKPELNLDKATAKAIRLCQKKGGTDIRVVASSGEMAIPGNGAIVKSGTIVGVGFQRVTVTDAISAAKAMCEAKGGVNPRVIRTWAEGNGILNRVYPGAWAGRL